MAFETLLEIGKRRNDNQAINDAYFDDDYSTNNEIDLKMV